MVFEVDLKLHRLVNRLLDALLLVLDLLNLFVLVLELLVEHSDTCLELSELGLVKYQFRLLANLLELLLPLFGDLRDLVLQHMLTILGLLDVLSGDCRIQTTCIFLSFHDQLSLQVHESV